MIPIQNSRQRCVLELYDHAIFFSLVCYRNNLFTSNDAEKIIEFYNGFDNRDQLIQWMKERPKGASYIHEVEGNRDIIVVIPTADFNGKYATTCREEIFTGLHMIFVESGENPDPYFNYAHNCNVGIKRAMEYSPKWVVVSNDDMIKIDDVSKLLKELKKLDEKEIDAVFTNEATYHSVHNKVVRRNIWENLNQFRTSKLFGLKVNRIKRKFGVRYSIVKNRKITKILFSGIDYVDFVDFAILSNNFVTSKNGILYDETFTNNKEDSDLSLLIMLTKSRVHAIEYRIGDLIGSSLGTGIDRSIRSLASDVYFTYKWESTLETH